MLKGPAWVPCRNCDEFHCRVHRMHACDCPCPPVDEVDFDPYATNPEEAAAESAAKDA